MANKAILIGIQDYPNPKEYPHVHYVLNDINDMDFILTNLGYETTKYVNEQATEGIDYEIRKIGGSLNEEDKVIFYFAGHGTLTPDGKNNLVLFDSGLLVEDVIKNLSINSKKVLIILDCCHSGIDAYSNTRDVKQRAFYTEDFIKIMNESNYCITLSACGKNETSHPLTRFEHGAFTYRLLQCLTGKIDSVLNTNGELVFSLLLTYLTKTIPNDVKTEKIDYEQHPCSYGNMKSDFILHKFEKDEFYNLEEKSFLENTEKITDIKIKYEETGYIGNLKGFKKGANKVYKTKTYSTEIFVKQRGEENLQEAADNIVNDILAKFDYSSSFNSADYELGSLFYEFPDFNLNCYIEQDNEDCEYYNLVISIEDIHDRKMISTNVFNDSFDSFINKVEIKMNDYRFNDNLFRDNLRNFAKKNKDQYSELQGIIEIYNFKEKYKILMVNDDFSIKFREYQTPKDIIDSLIRFNAAYNNIIF